jgi:thiol-disulfide isomerase/thioredoxin
MNERIRTHSSKWLPIVVLIGIALFPIAIVQMRESLVPFLSEAPLLRIHKTPIPLQPFYFADSSGRQRSLSDFKGQHVLVNVWATWCPPCRKEMPALDRLQAKLGATQEPQIIAISVDAISFDQLRAFYSVYEIRNLAIYNGDENEILAAMGIGGLPTTVLIDRDGNEMARLIGPTIWDAPEIVKQLSSLVSTSISAVEIQ